MAHMLLCGGNAQLIGFEPGRQDWLGFFSCCTCRSAAKIHHAENCTAAPYDWSNMGL